MVTWHVTTVNTGFLALRAEISPPGESSEGGIYLVRSPGARNSRDGAIGDLVRPWRCAAIEGNIPSNAEIFSTKRIHGDPRDLKENHILIPEEIVELAMAHCGVDPLARSILGAKVNQKVSAGLHEVSWEPDPPSDSGGQDWTRARVEEIIKVQNGLVTC